ncbi:glycosyltransferase family 1 protein [uncultured Rhizobium sp.]|uniref:glycosyltransferase family 4 protein n=1 Tax=uncultured Rhizobium sp. TaxID=155567 RepID=UPI001ACD43D5|nr:glycosyltransferase family 1 protein [uncultured Rhizobium sp.]MBN9034341.1 glycosyltransferase family 4 protein [Hyphomicrobiales bacterium]
MKIILSVQPIRFPMTGIGRYTLELARHLQAIPDIEELKFFGDEHFVDGLPVPGNSRSKPASLVTRIKHRLARNPVLLDIYRKRVHDRRGRALKDNGDYLYHGPNFYLPPFPGRSVVTIHDLSVFTMPEHHPVERVMFIRKEVEFALKQATMLITDAEYTRHEVADYFGWPLDKVRSAALAGGAEFYPRDAETVAPILARYDLKPGGYGLYTGTIEPRKNLIRLLDAYGRLPQALRQRFPLILAGYKGWNNEETVARIDKAEREGWARYLGFVPDADLPVLFAGARLFAFPSLYEGFGLPVLEAMASGIPVVTSTSSTLPEVAGDAAATCAPEDVETLTSLLAQGLDDDQWRRNAIEKGFAQAKKFSWQRCAEETAAIYRTALAR